MPSVGIQARSLDIQRVREVHRERRSVGHAATMVLGLMDGWRCVVRTWKQARTRRFRLLQRLHAITGQLHECQFVRAGPRVLGHTKPALSRSRYA